MWKNKDMQEKSDIIQARLQENLKVKKIDIDYEAFSNESNREINLKIRLSSLKSN